jgi:hypothetical protein
MLLARGANEEGNTILTGWWSRWAYMLMPNGTVVDITIAGRDTIDVGVSHAYVRHMSPDTVIDITSRKPVLLLLRHDHPDFQTIAQQVHLERLPLPQYLDAYTITDSTFSFHWAGRTFRKRAYVKP